MCQTRGEPHYCLYSYRFSPSYSDLQSESMNQNVAFVAGQEIRLRGRNTEDTEFVKAGAYHTLEIEPQRPFDITKQNWDVLDLERLRMACDPGASADLAAVLITVKHKAMLCPFSIKNCFKIAGWTLLSFQSWCLLHAGKCVCSTLLSKQNP